MFPNHWLQKSLCSLLACALVHTYATPCFAQSKGASEYFSLNEDGRLRIKVQLWGSVKLSGTHYVPDTYTLKELIGVAGGPIGELSRSNILLKREEDSTGKRLKEPEIVEFTGEELLKRAKYSAMHLRQNDTIYVETEPKSSEEFMQTLTVVSVITGIVSSLLLTYFVIDDRRNRD